MKKSELIERLSEFPDDLEVTIKVQPIGFCCDYVSCDKIYSDYVINNALDVAELIIVIDTDEVLRDS